MTLKGTKLVYIPTTQPWSIALECLTKQTIVIHPDISISSLSNSSLMNETANLCSINFDYTHNQDVDCKCSTGNFFSAYLSAPEGDRHEIPIAVV